MKTLTKLGAFVVALILVFTSAYVVGRIVGPPPTEAAAAPVAAPAAEEHGPGGLMVSEESLTIQVLNENWKAGEEQILAFQIQEREGTPLMQYKAQHDKLLHLVIARSDLSGFQHIHPNMGADGTWRIPVTFPEAGTYRIFADFFPGWGIHNTTLGMDINVAGNYAPKALPAPSNTATVDGYTVTLSGKLKPGADAKLTMHVSKNGKPVTDLEPYLAAYGHLVMLRGGDMAYIHVHPDGSPGDGKTAPGPTVDFYATAPSYGPYRLFLDFQHQGKVRTAEFTVNVEGPNPPPHGLTPEVFEQAKAINLSGGNSAAPGGPSSGGGSTGGATHGHGG
ncbi:MAG: hypothetical protein WBA97_17930 [Actinophytocola sp.]|uniref:hypothetical protein n=1 Tax=Actinophytocola sp. TaxID=1872138 RepID=UPI003C753D1D